MIGRALISARLLSHDFSPIAYIVVLLVLLPGCGTRQLASSSTSRTAGGWPPPPRPCSYSYSYCCFSSKNAHQPSPSSPVPPSAILCLTTHLLLSSSSFLLGGSYHILIPKIVVGNRLVVKEVDHSKQAKLQSLQKCLLNRMTNGYCLSIAEETKH